MSALLEVPAGFPADLAAVSHRLREREATADPASPSAAAEVLTLRHREVLLRGGRPEDLLALGAAVDDAVERFPTWPDLRLLRATLALAVHRPDVAATALAAVPQREHLGGRRRARRIGRRLPFPQPVADGGQVDREAGGHLQQRAHQGSAR